MIVILQNLFRLPPSPFIMMNYSTNESDNEKTREVIDKVTQPLIVAVQTPKTMGSVDVDQSGPISRLASNNEEAEETYELDDTFMSTTAEEDDTKIKGCCWLSDGIDDLSGMTFTQKMHHVLKNKELEEIISWLPSGRSFVIRNPKNFAKEIIPKYFGKNIAYTSFTRRLVRWGWRNIAKGTYYSTNFCRDDPGKCLLMTYSNKISNKPPGFSPIRGATSASQSESDTRTQAPTSNINNLHRPPTRLFVSENALVPSLALNSIQGMLRSPHQYPRFVDSRFYPLVIPRELSNNNAIGLQSASNSTIGLSHPLAPCYMSTHPTNFAGFPQQFFASNSIGDACRQRGMEQLQQVIAVEAALQAALRDQAHSSNNVAVSARLEASQSPSSNNNEQQAEHSIRQQNAQWSCRGNPAA